MRHSERHFSQRIGWLRAAVLGANDGIVSTASLIVGVAAASEDRGAVLIAGIAGLVAGAMSMAAGEYVSVSSQADTEAADLARERDELESNEPYEREELAKIYMERGLDAALAREVAVQLMAHDALAAHARDELGLSDIHRARPVQAALASAASFAAGAVIPVILVALVPFQGVGAIVTGTSLALLAVLGGLAAGAGGASKLVGAVRICFWGALAMGLTAAIGAAVGTSL
jgi:VIT1/CCC1 family predicted Fe2+/Mn2+ transporter